MVLILMEKGTRKTYFEGVVRGSFSSRNPPPKRIRHRIEQKAVQAELVTIW